MSFLTAEWRKLALANYEVEPDLLRPFLPHGTELDIWKDRCYLSLVGFMFRVVRLPDYKIPFQTEYEEVIDTLHPLISFFAHPLPGLSIFAEVCTKQTRCATSIRRTT